MTWISKKKKIENNNLFENNQMSVLIVSLSLLMLVNYKISKKTSSMNYLISTLFRAAYWAKNYLLNLTSNQGRIYEKA